MSPLPTLHARPVETDHMEIHENLLPCCVFQKQALTLGNGIEGESIIH